ncbi:MAG: histidine kinase A domain-containing [Desulfobulbaceae bacterium]|jgi:signal transduction histidine kinase|nr:MAG: histidine kinase A domain-containing [Desulfobulbaceae bacterium]
MNKPDTNSQYGPIGENGLQFFGKVSASISHEIKNVLAIINENAGLLEDLSIAAQRGAAIDPERLNRACQQFSKQIRRADVIIKNMNQFAHSVDQFAAPVDLYNTTELVSNLAGRLAAMRKVTLQVIPPLSPVVIDSNPFLLENLIWLVLEYALDSTSEALTLTLAPEKNDSGTRLRICGIDGLSEDFTSKLPVGCKDLLCASNAYLAVDMTGKALIIHLTEI